MDEKETLRLAELSRYERSYHASGYKYICGIDEAGRGPLAGPVVAACVILPENILIEGINDSKKVPKKHHARLCEEIMEKAVDHSVGMADEREIDRINILNATKLAMKRAIMKLKVSPDVLFIDYLRLEDIPSEQLSLVKGDSLSVSIAAASILAKHTRDNIMKEYALTYSEYGFDKNAGYGTSFHINAIRRYGICGIHRRTFIKNHMTQI